MTIVNVTWTDDDDDFIKSIDADYYKETFTDFAVDPLESSVALKKLHDETGLWYDLQDSRVIATIDPEVKATAELIRKYYTKKFFWSNFTHEKPLSSFRSRLCVLLETRERKLKEQDKGIIFKLPWFYNEDMAYDQFKKDYKTTELPYFKQYPQTKSIVKLKFLYTTKSMQKNRKTENFWFTKDDYLYNIVIALDNPLREMFTGMIEENPEPTFETFITTDRIDQMHFYKLINFRFKKENNA
jgi:hypothetical protein